MAEKKKINHDNCNNVDKGTHKHKQRKREIQTFFLCLLRSKL